MAGSLKGKHLQRNAEDFGSNPTQSTSDRLFMSLFFCTKSRQVLRIIRSSLGQKDCI